MQFNISIGSKIDAVLDNDLISFGNELDWEKSKSIRNILRAFLSLPKKKRLQMLNLCQEE